jgi:arsenate reductase (thioredoxin)
MYDSATMLSLTRIVVSLATATLTPALLPQTASTSPEVVFVCEHGAAKSVIAAAHFNRIAQQRGLNVRAVARGTNPDPEVAPKVVAGLHAEGLKEITTKPQLVSERDTADAKRIVTLGCKLPHKAETTDWNDIPSPGANYAAASSAIRSRVEALVDELATKELDRSKKAK